MQDLSRTQVRYTLSFDTIETIEQLSLEAGLTKSQALEQMVQEWLENKDKKVIKSTSTTVHDSSTGKRVDELQRTVEALAQKVQNLTFGAKLNRVHHK